MKVCTICGAENESELKRCKVCKALLPEVEISPDRVQRPEGESVKICEKCGATCGKNAVRCEKCGAFLNNSRRYVERTAEENIAPLVLQTDSGEVVTLFSGQIIGRQYQPKLWDIYTPRAAYKISFKNGRYLLENLKDNSSTPIDFKKEYRVGRKKVKFISET